MDDFYGPTNLLKWCANFMGYVHKNSGGESHNFNNFFLKTVSDPQIFRSMGREYTNNHLTASLVFRVGFTIYQQVRIY